jgi:ribosomal protein S18 acetylase RimI-like enzyme
VKIQQVSIADKRLLVEFLQTYGFSRTDKIESHDLEKYISTIISMPEEQNSVYVAKSGKIIGFIHVHWLPYLILGGHEGYISELFVLEEFRGQGIGSQLLNKIKQEAKLRDCIRLNLINSDEKESYLRGFYGKQGFIEREDFKNFVWFVEDT